MITILKNIECEYFKWDGSTTSAEIITKLLSNTEPVESYGVGNDGSLIVEYDDWSTVTIRINDVVVYSEFWGCRIISEEKFNAYFNKIQTV